jgi:hypothetical protein
LKEVHQKGNAYVGTPDFRLVPTVGVVAQYFARFNVEVSFSKWCLLGATAVNDHIVDDITQTLAFLGAVEDGEINNVTRVRGGDAVKAVYGYGGHTGTSVG